MILRRFFTIKLLLAAFIAVQSLSATSYAQSAGNYEGRIITSAEVVIEGTPRDEAAEAEMQSALHVAAGTQYTAVRVRESLQALFDSSLVSNARVEVSETCVAPQGAGATRPLCVRFIVRRQLKVGEVRLSLDLPVNSPISEDEMRARLNMLEPGSNLSESVLRSNADLIQAYLRDKGFYRADVTYTQVRDPSDPTGTRQTVVFAIAPGEQARVASFNIGITGFDNSTGFDVEGVRAKLKLQQGAPFSRAALGDDINAIRQAIIKKGYRAPHLDDPHVTVENNQVTIDLKGGIGPKVDVEVLNYAISSKALLKLLPIEREGNIDISAIVEGQRRLTNKLQENGYFFAEITYTCAVTPSMPNVPDNDTPDLCENLNPQDLSGHTVKVTYSVEPGRRFKLTDIRIEGTKELSISDVENDLRTQKATVLGIIPFLGYGRGYTSRELLEQDTRTIRARMNELGYRKANVTVRQGVSITGENLIITFVVEEGPRTKIAGLEIRGNKLYTDARLRNEIADAGRKRCQAKLDAADYTPCFQTFEGQPFSRAQARADGDSLLSLYARDGYIDASLEFSTVELPPVKSADGKTEEERVRLVYTIRKEGDKVYINRIFINGNVRTKKEAILEIITLREGQVLRAERLNESERALYATDAFRQVIIHTEPAGETSTGYKRRDVIIDVEELQPRVMGYGGGYSTDNGPLGTFDISNLNMFGKLRQGSFRLRASRRQQIVRLEYVDPRFQRYGEHQFAPLTLSAQYQRDSTITRFFRSTIDRGAFGIVQRLDQDGNPIDQFGARVNEPTINRFTFNAETQRVIDRKSSSILFLRYSYEDVRLFNISSLLIESILRPDRGIRLSRLGATFVRDTRNSQFDTTRGDFLTVDYSLALRQLGGNLSFNKLQLNYRRFYQLKQFRRTVLAGNLTLGAANLFNPRDRNDNGVIDDIDRTLPISERFFAGGSTTLRGIDFEEAGPRVVVPECFNPGQPQLPPTPNTPRCGVFRNSKGELIQLNPFTVPIGGNALAVVNLEARTSLTKALQVTPFYDGGNVFRSIRDIFGRGASVENDPNASLADRISAHNLHARWTHTVGLGIGIKTPVGGTVSIDYGWLLNPPDFLIPQQTGDPAVFRLKHGQINFRFTRAF